MGGGFKNFVFLIAILMMLIIFVMGTILIEFVGTYLPLIKPLIDNILRFKYLFTITILFVFLNSIYFTSTNFKRNFKENVLGAIISTILWIVISQLFSLYYTFFPLNDSVYGSLTGVIVMLFWLYICMNIIFVGAVINEVYFPQKEVFEKRKNKIINELKKFDEDINKKY